VLYALGEEELPLADPRAERQAEPALPGKALLHALEPAVDLAGRDRSQSWDPSASPLQADLPLTANCSAGLRAVCPYAGADSGWLMLSRLREEAAC
jgi:hypothetical protein